MTRSKDAPGEKDVMPQASVSKFFQSVEQRAWTDAEKELDVIRQKAENTQWSRGYTKALEGLMLSYRNNDDKNIYLPKVLLNRSGESMEALRKEFAGFSSDEIHGEYDRGYFKALEEYLATTQTLPNRPAETQQTLPVEPGVESDPEKTIRERKERC